MSEKSTVSSSAMKKRVMSSDIMRCKCGLRSPLKLSWTDANPGRRFFGCASYNSKKKACGFFAWFDPPTCPRGMEVGPYLIKKVKDLQSEVVVLRGSVKALKCIVGALCAIIAIMGALLFKAWK